MTYLNRREAETIEICGEMGKEITRMNQRRRGGGRDKGIRGRERGREIDRECVCACVCVCL